MRNIDIALKDHNINQLPHYQQVAECMADLGLAVSVSELHGILCGYLSTGAKNDANTYLQTLMKQTATPNSDDMTSVLFDVFTISQQQIAAHGFELQLLLPDDCEPLVMRAQAFSEWCDGFIHGLRRTHVEYDDLTDEDAQDAIEHISAFAEMDCQEIICGEADERALMEVCEYTRIAVIHIYNDLLGQHKAHDADGTTH
jgi:hypothetical protein